MTGSMFNHNLLNILEKKKKQKKKLKKMYACIPLSCYSNLNTNIKKKTFFLEFRIV